MIVRKTVAERFWEKVKSGRLNDQCWEWTGSIDNLGYGSFHLNRQTIRAHRVAFMLINGRIPPSQCVLHLCNNRKCVNPEHLNLGTKWQNTQQALREQRLKLKMDLAKYRWPVKQSIEPLQFPQLPPVIRVHQLTRYWYCEEENRGRVMEGWKAERPFSVALSEGTNFHDWMENRPRTKGETILNDKLEKWKVEHEFGWYEKAAQELYRPIYYNYGDGTPPAEVKVVCHPDNLRVISEDRKFYTQVEEYKTVARLEKLPDGTYGYPFFKRSQAEFQTQLYRWALGWVLPQVQESAHNDLILSIHKRPGGYLLKEYHFAYMGDAAIEAQIQWIFDGWTLRRDPLVPQRWKCDRCDPGFKSNCRIAKSNWTFGKIP